jgi:hypothetical protein
MSFRQCGSIEYQAQYSADEVKRFGVRPDPRVCMQFSHPFPGRSFKQNTRFRITQHDGTCEELQAIRRAKITGAHFDKVVFRDVVVLDVEAKSWTFSLSIVENCELGSITFQDSNVDLEARNSPLTSIRYHGGTFAIGGKGWTLDTSSFRDANVWLRGNGAIGGV